MDKTDKARLKWHIDMMRLLQARAGYYEGKSGNDAKVALFQRLTDEHKQKIWHIIDEL